MLILFKDKVLCSLVSPNDCIKVIGLTSSYKPCPIPLDQRSLNHDLIYLVLFEAFRTRTRTGSKQAVGNGEQIIDWSHLSPTKKECFLTMLRLFLSRQSTFCTKCSMLAARESPVTTPRAGARARQQQKSDSIFIQQQRRYVGGPAFRKYRLKSTIWIYGVGVGIALAVGLKYSSDGASSFCDVKVTRAEKTDRYKDAIKVSRDLVERIKVGTEVGL